MAKPPHPGGSSYEQVAAIIFTDDTSSRGWLAFALLLRCSSAAAVAVLPEVPTADAVGEAAVAGLAGVAPAAASVVSGLR